MISSYTVKTIVPIAKQKGTYFIFLGRFQLSAPARESSCKRANFKKKCRHCPRKPLLMSVKIQNQECKNVPNFINQKQLCFLFKKQAPERTKNLIFNICLLICASIRYRIYCMYLLPQPPLILCYQCPEGWLHDHVLLLYYHPSSFVNSVQRGGYTTMYSCYTTTPPPLL